LNVAVALKIVLFNASVTFNNFNGRLLLAAIAAFFVDHLTKLSRFPFLVTRAFFPTAPTALGADDSNCVKEETATNRERDGVEGVNIDKEADNKAGKGVILQFLNGVLEGLRLINLSAKFRFPPPLIVSRLLTSILESSSALLIPIFHNKFSSSALLINTA